MKAKIFGSYKSKTQPSVDLGSSAYPSPYSQDQRSHTPQQYPPLQPQPDADGNVQLGRSPSQRLSGVPIEVVGHVYAQPPPGDERLQDHRYSYLQANSSIAPPEKEQRRGFRDRIRLGGHNPKPAVDQQASQAGKTQGVGRSLSVRRKDAPNSDKSRAQEEQQKQQWALKHNSSSQLLSHNEEEEEQHNTFQLQHQYQGPPVPEKDQPPHEQYYIQPPPAGRPPQDYYPPPPGPLHRLNTEHSFPSSEDTFNTPGQQAAYQNQQQQHPQYQSYPEPQLHQTQQVQYQQHFPPPNAPPVAQYQAPANQNGGYIYGSPTDQGLSRSREASVQLSQEPQSAHPGRPSEQPLQNAQAQTQPELAQPQAGRVPAHQHSASQDPLFLQPPRGSSIQPSHPHPPPSPIQTGVAEDTAQPASATPRAPSPSDTASSSATMPRDSQSRSGIIRQVDPKSMPTSSRESTGLGQSGQPPTPGFTPQASQSGQLRPGQQASDDRGRESPGPKTDMTEEDLANFHQLNKEYKELREKYQKVKKYYFEKEAQVHALQDTLAHQRLSQSRTSLDDSEYVARFVRLDGLISQLAFSIRKSWKAIPDFLARTVNKDAIATGKQEMTAVGRAFISHWLVCEMFDRYFHPDLEIGLSMQLKQIYNNIRRFAPPFQSGEEEEALNSKLINWRLTTFDGLRDRLKAAEAAEHHHRLVAQLNEKLITDMSAFLQDPAPPDLSGGIYMIVELAVNIAVHLPLESRDVMIEYYLPGTLIVPEVMKVETGIPALMTPVASDSASDVGDHGGPKSSETSEAKEQDRASVTTAPSSASEDQVLHGIGGAARDEAGKKRGMFSGIISSGSSKKSTGAPPPAAASAANGKGNAAGATGSQTALSAPGQTGRETPIQAEGREQRVRMAVGASVQIRGRTVLVKAPVYGMP